MSSWLILRWCHPLFTDARLLHTHWTTLEAIPILEEWESEERVKGLALIT